MPCLNVMFWQLLSAVKIEPLDVEMENAEKPLIEKKCKPLKGTAVKKEKTMDPTVLSLLNSLSPVCAMCCHSLTLRKPISDICSRARPHQRQ